MLGDATGAAALGELLGEDDVAIVHAALRGIEQVVKTTPSVLPLTTRTALRRASEKSESAIGPLAGRIWSALDEACPLSAGPSGNGMAIFGGPCSSDPA